MCERVTEIECDGNECSASCDSKWEGMINLGRVMNIGRKIVTQRPERKKRRSL